MNKKNKNPIIKKPVKTAPKAPPVGNVDPKAKAFLESVVDKIRMGN